VTLTRRNDFPNLLVIDDDEIVVTAVDPDGVEYDQLVGDWRARVKNLLFADDNGVRNFRGEVDFIVCYVNRGRAADHAGVDHSITGRPVRGVIRMPGWDAAPANGNIDGHVTGGLAHEVAHYWLVPGGAQIVTDQGLVATPTSDQIAESLNRGNGLPRYAIIGREDSHWSPFIDSRNSPMDGINHSPPQPILEQVYGYAQAVGEPTSGVTVDVPGFRQVTTPHRYSDLELYLMGVLAPPSFSPADARMYVVRAQWVYPVPFQAGLYVECENGQKWYVGFDRGPHQLLAQAIDGTTPSTPTVFHTPFNPADLVAARAVQRGGTLTLQVRLWRGPDPLEGCVYQVMRWLGITPFWDPAKRPTKLSCSNILGDLSAGQPSHTPDAYVGWRTVATLNTRATHVGIAARHVEKACFARMSAQLCEAKAGDISSVPLADLTGVNLLNNTSPFFAKTLLDDGSFVLPYRTGPGVGGIFEHTPAVDAAPRLVRATSPGDFGFGAWLRLLNSCIVSWAGGSGVGKTYVGEREQFRFDQFDFATAWGASAAVRQAAPPDNTYNFLFCFLSRDPVPDATLVPRLTRIDLNRRVWQSVFPALTQGQRTATTTIP
jgi:hypothetical protein